MPDHDEPLPADAEVMLSKLTADAADKVLKKDLAEQQVRKNAKEENDPVLQLQRQEAQTKADEVKRKGLADRLRAMLGLEQLKSKEQMYLVDKQTDAEKERIEVLMEIQKLLTEEERVRGQQDQATAQLGVDIGMGIADDAIERERIDSQERIAELQHEGDIEKSEMQAQSSRVQTSATLAGKFMDLLRARTQRDQKENKNENNS